MNYSPWDVSVRRSVTSHPCVGRCVYTAGSKVKLGSWRTGSEVRRLTGRGSGGSARFEVDGVLFLNRNRHPDSLRRRHFVPRRLPGRRTLWGGRYVPRGASRRNPALWIRHGSWWVGLLPQSHMSEYYEEGGLLYERSPPMHIKVESPEGTFGGRASEDGFPREDDDSEGSCDRAGLPFNVVVVHPNVVAPGGASEQLLPLQQNRGLLPAALASGGVGKRKSRFSGAELEVLVSEVTRFEGELFGPAGRLRRRERERIWAAILERVNAVSRVPRTLREVKKRWDDLKRRSGGKLADARFRSWIPPSRVDVVLPGPAQLSPRFQATPPKIRSRGMPAFSCLSDTDPGDGSERDLFEREDESHEQEEDEPLSEGVDNSVDEKLGLALGLGIVPAPPSERWLPPSPLYSGPFLNGTPQQSPVPSLGRQQGPLPAPPSHASWVDDELRGLGEAAVRLGERLEQNLRDFGEGFRRDMRTLVASQEALTVSIQQNNVLLQRLLSLLELQVHPPPPPPPPPPTQCPQLPPHRLQNGSDGITAAPTSLPLPPDILDGTSRPESQSQTNSAGLSRGRTEHRRKRRH